MFVAAISLMLANAAIASPQKTAGPLRMTRSQVRAYNATLAPDHPNYIRCKRDGETGSLVKKTLSCATNQEWRRIEDANNQQARDVVEVSNRGAPVKD